ncbi:MAG: chitobiase/beta-hexosaminidase C-terminal domain-containing protein [Bacteroidales bacterium]|nr:chitobiase/beta-hexosaminidase C-terminal domain-containing protein [Bacteroidales bacterium]
MKKFLLSIFVIASAAASAFAGQSVTLDFTTPSAWTASTGDTIRTKTDAGWKAETTISYQGNDVTIKPAANAYFIISSGDTAFFIGKQGSTITLPKFDFRVGTLDLTFGNGVSTKVQVDFYNGETAFDQAVVATKSGSVSFTVPEALSAIGSAYSLKVTNANNLQIKKIVVNEYEAPEVNAPVIGLEPGVYASAQSVSITADEGCTIYYTVDGSDPTDASTKYTEPIEIKEHTLLKAIAYNDEDTGSPVAEAQYYIAYLYSNFLKDEQGWTVKDVTGIEGASVWNLDAKYGMKATGYYNKTANATESWLISPAIDLTNATSPALILSHAAGNYKNTSISDMVSVLASEDGGTNWTKLEVANWPTSWTYITSQISLKSYIGKSVLVAIRYTSTDAEAGTYETNCASVEEVEGLVEYKHIANTIETAYTTAQAKALIDDELSILTDTVYVTGVVSSIETLSSDGHLTYWLDSNTFEAYSGLNLDSAKFTSKNDIHKGDTLIIQGTIKCYNGTYELDANNVIVSLKACKDGVDIIDPTNAAEDAYTVAKAIELVNAADQYNTYDMDQSIFIKGVIVTKPSYAPSKKAISFYIKDNTSATDSIKVSYCFSFGGDSIQSDPEGSLVKIGDEVVVCAVVYYTGKNYQTSAGGYLYSVNGSTSALECVPAPAAEAAQAKVIYNILGQRVDAIDSKGIYFVNGKKIIVR